MDSLQRVEVQGLAVLPAQLDTKLIGSVICDRISGLLRISRNRWVSDEEVVECFRCTVRFNALRRKHHCRQCGRIFCSQCCYQKMWLRHLGYSSEQRICSLCAHFVSLLNKVQSSRQSDKMEAAVGLNEMSKDVQLLPLFIEMGGVIALVNLLCDKDQQLISVVLRSLLDLFSVSSVHTHLVDIGVVPAVSRILSNCGGADDCNLMLEAIRLLTFLFSSESVKSSVLDGDVLDIMLSLCNAHYPELVCVAALQLINVVSTNGQVCDAIVDNMRRNSVAKLLAMTSSTDERVQTAVLKILSQISVSSVRNRRRLVEEELYRGSSLTSILCGRVLASADILAMVVCLVANLAVDEGLQGALSSHLLALCQLAETIEATDINVLRQTSRGLANFSQFNCNADILIFTARLPLATKACFSLVESEFLVYQMPQHCPTLHKKLKHFSVIGSKFIRCSDSEVQSYSCLLALALLGFKTDDCIESLLSSGCVAEFIRFLASDKEALGRFQRHLVNRLPNTRLA